MSKQTSTDFIPVHQYAKLKKVPAQKVYRWLREGKIAEGMYRKEEVKMMRIRIHKDLPAL